MGWEVGGQSDANQLTCPALLIFGEEVDLFTVWILLRQAHQPLRREKLAVACALVEGSAPTEIRRLHVGAALVVVGWSGEVVAGGSWVGIAGLTGLGRCMFFAAAASVSLVLTSLRYFNTSRWPFCAAKNAPVPLLMLLV